MGCRIGVLFRAARIGLLMALLPVAVLAQAATGSIVGSVADGQANPLNQVTVTIDGAVKRSVVTDATALSRSPACHRAFTQSAPLGRAMVRRARQTWPS